MLNVGKFLSQVKTEMQKVAWPTRSELVSSTVVVIISTLILGLFIGICDLVLAKAVNFLISGAV
jgi:preprotein translocase subunit SecE